MELINMIFYALIIGLIPAIIGYKKGHSFWGWWFGGTIFFVVALPWVIIAAADEDELARRKGLKKCGNCAEFIKPEAKVCRFCNTPNKPAKPIDNFVTYPECGAESEIDSAVCSECGGMMP